MKILDVKSEKVECQIAGCDYSLVVTDETSRLGYTLARNNMDIHVRQTHSMKQILDALWLSMIFKLKHVENGRG